MLLWIFKLYRATKTGLLSGDSARQLSWGIALGIVLGLIPKGNLLAISVALLMFALSINHSLAIVATALVMLLGTFFDPVSHRIGETLLLNPTIRTILSKLQTLPVLPWFSLNNTVVLGSFVLGLTVMAPSYWLAFPIMKWIKSRSKPVDEPTPPPPVTHREIRFDPPTEAQLVTHIDVVRLSRLPEEKRKQVVHEAQAAEAGQSPEALRYLVRHVRETRGEKVA